MNGKAWTATPLVIGLVGLVVLAVGVPYAAADDPKVEVFVERKGPEMSPEAKVIGDPNHPDPPAAGSFKRDPEYTEPYDAAAELEIYSGKKMIDRPRPPIEWGLRLYDRGAYTPRPTWLGAKNPIGFHLMSYGDLRVAAAYNDNGVAGANGETHQSTLAARLNVDVDAQFTATERVHLFARPLDKNGSFTRYQIGGKVEDDFVHELDFNLDTLFFEGDLGAMRQGLTGKTNPIDLPIAIGRFPMITQNGVWIEDAIDGAAFSITAKTSPKLDISNMDFTFFVGLNKVTTPADPGDKARVFGMAGFADLLRGYLEYGYGYLDADASGNSYHNITAAFSKRYRGRLSNSVRLIGNLGQKGAGGVKTADGLLVLVENSIVWRRLFESSPVDPLNFVPYFNFFAGFNSPQSLARGGDSGGVLRNTGIAFESDGMTGYPTLDARAQDSYGGAVGLEYLFKLDRQIVIEAAVVERMGSSPLGSQYSIGARYQHPFTSTWIVRLDAMKGWQQGQKGLYGMRVELRRKF
jgi:hypothetical protein